MAALELAVREAEAEAVDPSALTGIRIGDILVNKYRVDAWLGIGGMGAVLAATHLFLDDRVAIKVLLPDALGVSQAVTRFAREARAAARIKSDHVVRVTDVGQLPGGLPFIVMEYLKGQDLAAILAQRGPLPEAVVVGYLSQVCRGVAHAHARGVVHRDLKPSNLFVAKRADGSDVVKVLDFGISKLVHSRSSTLDVTNPRQNMGTPDYVSPEQLHAAGDIDGRADIWSIGIIAYELLTGRTPFEAESRLELCWKIMQERTPSLRSARPGISPQLEAVIQRCLEKDPSRRYPDAHELRLALDDALDPVIEVSSSRRRSFFASLALGVLLGALVLVSAIIALDSRGVAQQAPSASSADAIMTSQAPVETGPMVADGRPLIVAVEDLPIERPPPARELRKPARRTPRPEVARIVLEEDPAAPNEPIRRE